MVMIYAFRHVFRRLTYLIFALVAGSTMFLLSLWIPSISLIAEITGRQAIPLSQKLLLPFYLTGLNFTALSSPSAFFLVVISILFGINLAMMIYLFRRRIVAIQRSGITVGFFGIASGVLGTGCAACGSILLTSSLSFFGASSILALLPLRGGEFGILGVVLLTISTHQVAKQIENPAVCKI